MFLYSLSISEGKVKDILNSSSILESVCISEVIPLKDNCFCYITPFVFLAKHSVTVSHHYIDPEMVIFLTSVIYHLI